MSADVIPLRRHHDTERAQQRAQAVRHRDVSSALATGALRSVEILVSHAVAAGRLDHADLLGLQLALSGARAAADELAAAHRAVEAASGEVCDG